MPPPRLFHILLLIAVMGAVLPVLAEETEQFIIYQSDFSKSPGWITNNPSRYYWDPEMMVYHYETEGGTNGNSYIPIEYDGGSFVLEYDVTPVFTGKDGAIRLGVTSTEMDISKGTNILGVFENGKYGRLMSLKCIDQNNHLHETTSHYSSYCASQKDCGTKEFSDNRTYHVTIRYNKELQNADIKVTDKETGNVTWGYYINIGQDLFFLNRIAITSKGDYTIGNNAEGYIDNIVMSGFRDVPPTTTVQTSIPTTLPVTLQTSSPTPVTSPPTQSPLSTCMVMLGPSIAAIAYLVFGGWERE